MPVPVKRKQVPAHGELQLRTASTKPLPLLQHTCVGKLDGVDSGGQITVLPLELHCSVTAHRPRLKRPARVLQSFDLQRVLEGEKALRTEAARQLKEVEKKLVSLRSPAVSLSSPMMAPPGSLSSLEREQDQLQQQIRAHSAQVSR